MSRPVPSTRGMYRPGIGITVTRENIHDEQVRRLDAKRPPADAEEIVKTFAPVSVIHPELDSKRFAKLVHRADRIMRKAAKARRKS